jgi:hypothetical protein
MWVGLSFMIVVFVLSLTTSEPAIQGVLNTKDALYAAFLNSPPPVLGLLFLLVAGGAFFVWKNCVRAFRRLDITDLAPPVNAMGWWGVKE